MNRTLIEKFYGLNQTGDTELKLGESPYMKNIYITDNYNAYQVYGYEQLNAKDEGNPVRAIWDGYVDDTYYLVLIRDGSVMTLDNEVETEIGTVTDGYAFMFGLNNKLYIMTGSEYKYWDGTTYGDVSSIAYIPTIATATPPAGGGTDVESVNYLTGKRTQIFSGDASSTSYVLREDSLTATTLVVDVDGVSKTEGVDFTVNRTTGVVTPTPATVFTNGTSNVSITYEVANTSSLAEIVSCRRAMEFETRIHFWGGTYGNRRYYSGLDSAQITAEYITDYTLVGSGDITDIKGQYDRQIIATTKGSFYSYYQDLDGVIAFPVRNLNEVVGNRPFGQMQVIDNYPVSFSDGAYLWKSISVKDERNADIISKNVIPTYETFVEEDILTVDNNFRKELWIAYQNKALIYNYLNLSWYYYELPHTITALRLVDKYVMFGTSDGQLMHFNPSFENFNGLAIESEMHIGYYDWGEEWLRKYMREIFISIEPSVRVNWDVYWTTDNNSGENSVDGSIGYNVLDFTYIDFNNFTFLTSTRPTPQKVRTKAKKFTYFMLILKNSKLNYTANVLSINYIARTGGKAK